MTTQQRRGMRGFIVDSAANLIYWHPTLALWETLILGYTFGEMLTARLGNITLALILGGLFGRFIDYMRAIFSKKQDSRIKTALVDALSTSVFWNATLLPWLAYSKKILDAFGVSKYAVYIGISGTNFGPEKLIYAALGYTVVYALAGGPYGRFLNWFRKKTRQG